ncbi:calmodulin-dependent cyclic-nucleotide phosphodiesterase [Aureococcus anophagefferens]|nr:calmodulin-dependent cyclic-nucleotide phosphodiesterase [Aureococcus anophagefferens]
MLGKLDAYEKSKTPLEFDGEELVMISAYGATPHKAEVSRVLGESKGAGVRAVKNLIAKNRAVEAFGASSSFKAPAAYFGDDVAARAVDDDNDHTLLVVLLAALAHDVGHVGLTNAYLVETGHDFAVRYNDQSPLENYHVATALSIVEAKGFWDSFDAPGKRMGRLYWIECVLATDMAHHMAAMAQLDGLLRKEGAAGDAATPANHLAVVKAIVHACDISAPTKPVKTHLRWTDLVMEEFYAQAENGAGKECEIPNFKGSDLGHAEKELANGKAKPSVPPRGSVVLGKFQLGFIGFIRPLFAKIAAIPSVDFDAPLKNIDVVKNHWIAETEPKPADKLPALWAPPPHRVSLSCLSWSVARRSRGTSLAG